MLIDVSSNAEFEELASRLSEILLLRVASEKTTSEPSCSLMTVASFAAEEEVFDAEKI
jgi:hypothetical protein